MSQTTTKPAPAGGNGNVPAKAGPISTLRELLERSRGQIALALPKHLTADRMIRVAMTCVQGNDALLKCQPLTIVGCVMKAAELGLELSGPLGQAYMVAYGTNATFQIGYRGYIRLAFNSGMVSTVAAELVHERDEFDCWMGTRPGIRHKPARGDRGEVQAVYAVATMKDGASIFEYMTAQQVEQHRKRYSRAKGADSPWETAWNEMARKTVLRRLLKHAPLSTEVQRTVGADERREYAEGEIVGDESPRMVGEATQDIRVAPPEDRDEQVAEQRGDAHEG